MASIKASEHGKKLLRYITKDRKDLTNIYLYAIFNGIVYLSIPLGIQSIISYVMGATMVTSIYILICFVVIGTFLVGYFKLKVLEIIEKIQQKIYVEFSMAFAEKLPKVDLFSTRKYYLPELVNRFFDIQNLQKGISKILLEIPTALIQILFGILLLSFYHPLFLVFGGLVILSVGGIFYYTMESGIKSSLDESDKKYDTASWLEDVADSVKTFKMHSEKGIHLIGTDNRVLEYIRHRTTHFKVLVLQYKTIVAFNVIITFTMLAIGTYLMVNQQLNIGAFIATEIVLLTIMAAVEKLIVSLESYYDLIAAYAKLTKVTELKEEKDGEIKLLENNKGISIEFQNVNFSFNETPNVLSNINFKLNENTISVVTGEMGSGKSLLLNILAGFYDPSSGSILFDKIPLKNLNKEYFRNHVGLYLETTKVIKGTVQENILLGNTQSNTESILMLSEKLGIDNISSRFSQGFSTEISETDSELSFNTKKKILILRSLLGDKKLLLLENPLAGMSDKFKEHLIHYLNDLKQHTTIVIVSPDKNLIAHADQHIHLEKGTLRVMP
ncbi:ATP-binding cassette domain-containing protein [Chishuiella sp.]|uniref:ATP-binding cassette domain-containing protein n=1 Tax=Chishuiella sp. TaxID=1969467 RepID=UPI0028AE0D55|nr:ATP-binding cassette domain-containing protein [Chishuiella sp.]